MEGRQSRKTQAAPFKRTRGAFWPDASHMRQPAPRWETKGQAPGQAPWFPKPLLAPAPVPTAERPQHRRGLEDARAARCRQQQHQP
jgi:hypothetical protein